MGVQGPASSGDLIRWEELTPADKIAIKLICESSLIGFVRIFFQLIQGQKFLRNWHHQYFCRVLEAVYEGKLHRVIMNCPPGSTKTEIVSIHWPIWCMIQNLKHKLPTRWLPISYSDDLVAENSGRTKEIIESAEFQELWPMSLSKDNKAKADWKFIDEHGNQHRLFGTSLMGQVTGRRAGFMLPGFTGALMLDDPLPPRDESYGRKIDKFNKALNRIVRSRLAHDAVPIVMIQQRIAKNDSTAFLTSDKAPDKYSLAKIPAVLDREYVDKLPASIRKEAIRDTGFVGSKVSYWETKEPLESLQAIEAADAYLFHSQYQQAPNDAFLEGVIFRQEIETLIQEGRALNLIPVEKSLPVYSFWDIGLNDLMAIWLVQFHRMEIRLIGCYANNNTLFETYINWLINFRDRHNIRFAKHYGPHDLEVRDIFTAEKRIDTARAMGVDFTLVERCKVKGESIDALRRLFPRIVIDINRCGPASQEGKNKDINGWEALKKYRREWDPDNEVFNDKPVHDWSSNYADALQQMGLVWLSIEADLVEQARANMKSFIRKSPRKKNWKTG